MLATEVPHISAAINRYFFMVVGWGWKGTCAADCLRRKGLHYQTAREQSPPSAVA